MLSYSYDPCHSMPLQFLGNFDSDTFCRRSFFGAANNLNENACMPSPLSDVFFYLVLVPSSFHFHVHFFVLEKGNDLRVEPGICIVAQIVTLPPGQSYYINNKLLLGQAN